MLLNSSYSSVLLKNSKRSRPFEDFALKTRQNTEKSVYTTKKSLCANLSAKVMLKDNS